MTEDVDNVVEVQDLTAGYNGEVVLDGLSFQVARTEKFFIVGESGCGKTTLLNNLVGVHRPESGYVWIQGNEITEADADERYRIRRRIGVAFQGSGLFNSRTVLENVRLPIEEHTVLPKQAMDMICMMKLQLVGLHEAANLLPAELSGGMQKRVAIARALALDPDVVFLDEPTEGLDPPTATALDQLILSLSASLKSTFVVISHRLSTIFAVADRAVVMHCNSGQIIASGSPADLRDYAPDQYVRDFFKPRVGKSR